MPSNCAHLWQQIFQIKSNNPNTNLLTQGFTQKYAVLRQTGAFFQPEFETMALGRLVCILADILAG
jgi:hypothetical protein